MDIPVLGVRASVREQDVQASPFRCNAVKEVIHIGRIGHVTRYDNRFAAVVVDRLRDILENARATATQGDLRSRVCQRDRACPSDACPRPGDDRHLACQCACTHRRSPASPVWFPVGQGTAPDRCAREARLPLPIAPD